MGEAGFSDYRITRELNERRFPPPDGRRWQRPTVKYAMRQMGVYRPGPRLRTSAEAEALIERHARRGASVAETRSALERAGLQTAAGNADWSDGTVRRIRERLGYGQKRLSDAARFEKKTELDPTTGCVLWQGRTLDGGPDSHGQFEVDGRSVLAHRWAWEQAHGPLSPETHLHHVCKNPSCVTTAHLQPVAASEHRAWERDEDAIRALSVEQFRAEIATTRRATVAEAKLKRVGALRPHQVRDLVG